MTYIGSLGGMSVSRKAIAIAALPGLTMLVLFYTLAIHMRESLGAWPDSIGERGFRSGLVIHCAIAVDFDCAVFLTVPFLPVPILACVMVERWRRFLVYFVTYGGCLFLCFFLMQFAPDEFLAWWRD